MPKRKKSPVAEDLLEVTPLGAGMFSINGFEAFCVLCVVCNANLIVYGTCFCIITFD